MGGSKSHLEWWISNCKSKNLFWKHLLLKILFLFLRNSYCCFCFYIWYWLDTNLQCINAGMHLFPFAGREKDDYVLFVHNSFLAKNKSIPTDISRIKVCRVSRLFLVENASCILSYFMQLLSKTVFIQKTHLCLESRFSHVLELFPFFKNTTSVKVTNMFFWLKQKLLCPYNIM